jgi:small nuclear ribonucleoprotein
MDYGISVAQRMIKPLSVLSQAVNKNVIVELKGKREYRGVLDGYDPHMNVVLKNAEELVNGESVRKHALAIVRGDNVIYISP